MKKLKTIVLPLLMFITIFGSMLETASAQEKKIRLDIHIVFELGRKSRDCKGFGICIMIESAELSGTINARLIPKGGILQLKVPMEVAEKSPDQYNNDVFIMEEDFEIPKDIVASLGAEQYTVIPRGKYPIENKEKFLLINIPLK